MFFILELDSLRKENRILRKKRGLACGCSGDCASHYQGFILFYAELFDHHVLLLAVQVRSKRKVFDQMSKYGKKKSLRDVRGLFKLKEIQYKAPISRMAGFLIQQVTEL